MNMTMQCNYADWQFIKATINQGVHYIQNFPSQKRTSFPSQDHDQNFENSRDAFSFANDKYAGGVNYMNEDQRTDSSVNAEVYFWYRMYMPNVVKVS